MSSAVNDQSFRTKDPFPSGHTSMAFASASVLMYRYPWYVGAVSMAAASSVAFTRLDKNVHFASDVAAGAGLGILFATSVHLFHQNADTSEEEHDGMDGALYPLLAENTYGLTWSATF